VAYTFGGATGDDANFPLATTAMGDTRNLYISGWWKPTTLTAGRALFGVATVPRVEINSTTSELRIWADCATTDGQWTTSGVGLTVDLWTFIAFVHSWTSSAPATASMRLWRGTIDEPPVEVTISQATAPSGGPTGGSTLAIGNATSATSIAFQGEIAEINAIVSRAAVSVTHPLYLTSGNSIGNTEAELIRSRLVEPSWRGGGPYGWPFRHRLWGPTVPTSTTTTGWHYWDAKELSTVERVGDNSFLEGIGAVTINGATISLGRCPRPTLRLSDPTARSMQRRRRAA
jgi:hypothetical protein